MLTVSWLNLGDVQLTAGKHRFDVETSQADEAAFDCWLLIQGKFVPDGINKPDEKDR